MSKTTSFTLEANNTLLALNNSSISANNVKWKNSGKDSPRPQVKITKTVTSHDPEEGSIEHEVCEELKNVSHPNDHLPDAIFNKNTSSVDVSMKKTTTGKS